MEKRQEHPSTSATPASAGARGNELSSLHFAQLARQLGVVAAEHGYTTPAFRSPPRVPGVNRSITRRRDGSATVAVALRGRPAAAIVADMIDGVLAANEPGRPVGRPGRNGLPSTPPSTRPSTRPSVLRDLLWSAALPYLTPVEQPVVDLGQRRAA